MGSGPWLHPSVSQCLRNQSQLRGGRGCWTKSGAARADPCSGRFAQTTCYTLFSPQKPKDFDFAQQKLTDKNLGFQMLQKMGWKEGHGLGSCGKGIREPVSVYAAGAWGQGWGGQRAWREEAFSGLLVLSLWVHSLISWLPSC